MEAPRHGWQDTDEDFTHAIEPITAKFFRFIYDKKGSEPGSEDLDAAKWKPSLKILNIELRPKVKSINIRVKMDQFGESVKEQPQRSSKYQLCAFR